RLYRQGGFLARPERTRHWGRPATEWLPDPDCVELCALLRHPADDPDFRRGGLRLYARWAYVLRAYFPCGKPNLGVRRDPREPHGGMAPGSVSGSRREPQPVPRGGDGMGERN